MATNKVSLVILSPKISNNLVASAVDTVAREPQVGVEDSREVSCLCVAS